MNIILSVHIRYNYNFHAYERVAYKIVSACAVTSSICMYSDL